MDYSSKLARRTHNMSTSAIRELFKVLGMPGMISLAGGMPAAESFAVETIRELGEKAIELHGASIYQYGITEGFPALRQALSAYLSNRQIQAGVDEIGVSTGAQGAMDAAAKVLLDQGDLVALEAPTFLAAVKAFKTYEADFVDLPTDEAGVIPEGLAEIAKNRRPKLVYLIPNFQNPTGRTLALERRHAIARIAREFELLIVEDDPYYELRYRGDDLPPLKALAPEHVIYLGSLSKVFSPGMRLGYYLAPKPIADLMHSVRQAADVHANLFAQAVAALYVSEGHLERQLPAIRTLYRERLDAMLEALEENFRGTGFRFSQPEGGMFVWLEGPPGFDVQLAYQQCLERKVAFVPGRHFYTSSGAGLETIRLNFTCVAPNDIRAAIAVLAEVAKAQGND